MLVGDEVVGQLRGIRRQSRLGTLGVFGDAATATVVDGAGAAAAGGASGPGGCEHPGDVRINAPNTSGATWYLTVTYGYLA